MVKELTDVYFKRSYFVLNPNLGSCFERGRALSTPYSFFSQCFWVYRSLLYPPHTCFFPGWDVCQRVKLDSSLTISKHEEKVNYTNPAEISWDLQSSWVTFSLVCLQWFYTYLPFRSSTVRVKLVFPFLLVQISVLLHSVRHAQFIISVNIFEKLWNYLYERQDILWCQ